MKKKFKLIINPNLNTAKLNLRVALPYYDYSHFKELINMACCYNAEIQYVNEILCIEIYNIGLR